MRLKFISVVSTAFICVLCFMLLDFFYFFIGLVAACNNLPSHHHLPIGVKSPRRTREDIFCFPIVFHGEMKRRDRYKVFILVLSGSLVDNHRLYTSLFPINYKSAISITRVVSIVCHYITKVHNYTIKRYECTI